MNNINDYIDMNHMNIQNKNVYNNIKNLKTKVNNDFQTKKYSDINKITQLQQYNQYSQDYLNLYNLKADNISSKKEMNPLINYSDEKNRNYHQLIYDSLNNYQNMNNNKQKMNLSKAINKYKMDDFQIGIHTFYNNQNNINKIISNSPSNLNKKKLYNKINKNKVIQVDTSKTQNNFYSPNINNLMNLSNYQDNQNNSKLYINNILNENNMY